MVSGMEDGESAVSTAVAAASVEDCAFPVGSVVQFKTALDGIVQGQVLLFDAPLKVLAIRETSTGRSMMRIFNLSLISDVRTLQESNGEIPGIPVGVADQRAIHERKRDAEVKKKSSLLDAEVSPEGQCVYLHLRKLFSDVHWQGSEISMLKKTVVVLPPYTAESVEPLQETEACKSAVARVKKVLLRSPPVPPTISGCCKPAGTSSTTDSTAPADPK